MLSSMTEENMADIDIDYLIVGAGPAGASLACFLGRYGLKGLMISSAPSTAHTPRAHVINQPTMECIRDLDPNMEQEFRKLGYHGVETSHTRFANTMSGKEYGRVFSWGSGPDRMGDFQSKSPCTHLELPQTLVEPILIRYATQHGFPCRFNTSFVSFQVFTEPDCVITTVQDTIFKTSYKIRSKYLFGADGARSKIVQQLPLPLTTKPSQGTALNVLIKADMSNLIKTRMGLLHYIIQPNVDNPDFASWAIVRMVKPWSEWLIILMYAPSLSSEYVPTQQQVEEQVAKIIDDDSISVQVVRIDKWVINEQVAQSYSKDRVFCLGDAVHRHPPMNGLGANTCIQDAANLAWKVAMVEKGIAGPGLLDTYSIERQPVGEMIVRRANDSLREYIPIFDALGFLAPTLEERKQTYALLEQNSSQGREQRRKLVQGLDNKCHEFLAQGSDMNQKYESTAVYLENAGGAPVQLSDSTLYHEPHTYPGLRLPHAWLNTPIPGKQISTLDLAGKGRFTLFISIDGKGWREAAKVVEKELRVEIVTYSIGMGQEYEAVYNKWYHLCEVEEDGCVLVRPDNFVAWRSIRMVDDCVETLKKVFSRILSLE